MSEEEDEEEEKRERDVKRRRGMMCPYLDTINRAKLDFDFEKVCSISLSTENVYACLVCGKYYQGRGRSTHAFTHSTQSLHHMFIHLETCKTYCLPENYEVTDSSLQDIVRCLKPRFERSEVASLDARTALARDVHGVAYLPGYCGLNNLTKTDYVNAVVHSLAHVQPVRDFFLVPENYAKCRSPLVAEFGRLVRKIWSRDNFKSVVSPHEFVQRVTVASKRTFKIGTQADAVEFLVWLIHTMHKALKSQADSSILMDVFQGRVKVETLSRKTISSGVSSDHEGWHRTETEVPFTCLALDVPPTPLFKDSQGGNIIPQIPLFDVLTKYDGVKLSDSVKNGVQYRKRYVIAQLPPYLIFHFVRFSKNTFYSEKNPTIVNFPVKNLQLKDQFAFVQEPPPFDTKYDLVSNACHRLDAGLGKDARIHDPLQHGSYCVHVRHPASDKWYEIQDLHVAETMPQLIGLSESIFSIYGRTSSSSSSSSSSSGSGPPLRPPPPGLSAIPE